MNKMEPGQEGEALRNLTVGPPTDVGSLCGRGPPRTGHQSTEVTRLPAREKPHSRANGLGSATQDGHGLLWSLGSVGNKRSGACQTPSPSSADR